MCLLDERAEGGEGSGFGEEGVAEQLGGPPPVVHIHLEALVQKVLEGGRQVLDAWDLGPPRRRDQVEGSERRFLQVRRLPVNHLDRHYPQRPNVHLRPVLLPGHHLHTRGANKRI